MSAPSPNKLAEVLADWPVDGPGGVQFRPGAFARLAAEMMAGFERYPWGGVEIGGILTGSHEGDSVAILDYRVAECEHAEGPSFELSEGDRAKFGLLLEGVRKEGMEVVGWFHSVSHRGVGMSAADEALAQEFFPESGKILVVAKRVKSVTPAAVIFQKGESAWRESSAREFGAVLAAPVAAVVVAEEADATTAPAPDPETHPVPATVNPAMAGGLTRKQWLVPSKILVMLTTFALAVSAILLLQHLFRRDPAPSPGVNRVESPMDLQVEARANGLNLVWSTGASAVTNAVAGQMVITEQNKAQRIIDLDSQALRNGRMFYVPSSDHVRFCLELKNPKNQISNACTFALLASSRDNRVAPASVGIASKIGLSVAKQNTPLGVVATATVEPKFHIQSQTPVESPPRRDNSNPPVLRPLVSDPALRLMVQKDETTSPPATATAVPELAPSSPTSETHQQVISASQIEESNRSVGPEIPPATPPIAPGASVVDEPKNESKPLRSTSFINYKLPVAKFESVPKLDAVVRSMIFKDTEIEVTVSIDEAGRVVRAELVGPRKQAEGPLAAAALSAAKRWRFVPAQSDGKPVPSEHLIQFRFRK